MSHSSHQFSHQSSISNNPMHSPHARLSRRGLRGVVRTVSRVTLALGIGSSLSCLEKAAPTESVAAKRVALTLTASLSRAASGAATGAAATPVVVLTASYFHASNERVVLAEQTILATSGPQRVRFLVDLAPCLADVATTGGSAGGTAGATTCPLRVDVALRDATTNATLDSVVLGPISAAPGQSIALETPTVAIAGARAGLAGVTTFALTADGGGATTAYAWDFGDSTTGAGATATHQYAKPGVYHPTATLSGPGVTGRVSTTVTVGTLTGLWSTPQGLINHRLLLTQTGTTLTGHWFVEVGRDSPFAAPDNDIHDSPVTGTVSDPMAVTLFQNDECLRHVTGTIDGALGTLTGTFVNGLPLCDNNATGPFGFTLSRDTTTSVQSITFAGVPAGQRIDMGGTFTITATVATGNAATSRAIIWTSSDHSVATVTTAGAITALAGGTATIRATSVVDPHVWREIVLTVGTPTVVHSVTISPASTLLALGGTTQFAVSVDADPAADHSVTWSSSNTATAPVVGGLVTGVASGAAVITARSVSTPTLAGTAGITVLTPKLTIGAVNDGNGVPTNLLAIKGTMTATIVGDVSLPGITSLRLRATTGGVTTTVATAPAGPVLGPVTARSTTLTMDTTALPDGPMTFVAEALAANGQVVGTSGVGSGTIKNH